MREKKMLQCVINLWVAVLFSIGALLYSQNRFEQSEFPRGQRPETPSMPQPSAPPPAVQEGGVKTPISIREKVKLDIDKIDKITQCNTKLQAFIKGFKGIGDVETSIYKDLSEECDQYIISNSQLVDLDTDLDRCDLGNFKLQLKPFEIEFIYKRLKSCKEHIALKLWQSCDLNSFISEKLDSNGKRYFAFDVKDFESKCGTFINKTYLDFEDCDLGDLQQKFTNIDFESLHERLRACEDENIKNNYDECDLPYFVKRSRKYKEVSGDSVDNVVFDEQDIDYAIKRCSSKLQKKLWKWEDCDFRKDLKIHIANYKKSKDNKILVQIKNIGKNCKALIDKKLHEWKNCNIDDVISRHVGFDADNLYTRVKVCKEYFEKVKSYEFLKFREKVQLYKNKKKGIIRGGIGGGPGLPDQIISVLKSCSGGGRGGPGLPDILPIHALNDLGESTFLKNVDTDGDGKCDSFEAITPEFPELEAPEVTPEKVEEDIQKDVQEKIKLASKTFWDIEECGLGKLKARYKNIDIENVYNKIQTCKQEYEKKRLEECEVGENATTTTTTTTEEYADPEICKQSHFEKIWGNCKLDLLNDKLSKITMDQLYSQIIKCKGAIARSLIKECKLGVTLAGKLKGKSGGGSCRLSKNDGGPCDPTSPNFEGINFEVPEVDILNLDNESLVHLVNEQLLQCKHYKEIRLANFAECKSIELDKDSLFEQAYQLGKGCKIQLKTKWKECDQKSKNMVKYDLKIHEDQSGHGISGTNRLHINLKYKYQNIDIERVAKKLDRCKKDVNAKLNEKCEIMPVLEKGKSYVSKFGGKFGKEFVVGIPEIGSIITKCASDFKLKIKERGECEDKEVEKVDTTKLEQLEEEIKQCKKDDDVVKKVADCDFTDLEIRYPELNLHEVYRKVSICKTHIAEKIWEQCSLETQGRKWKKLLRVKANEESADTADTETPLRLKVKFNLRFINQPMKKCQAYKTIFDWKECELQDIKAQYPEITADDIEEIYDRLSECEQLFIF